jgi:hypothetical protein
MHGRCVFKPGLQVIGILEPDVFPASFPPSLADLLLFVTKAPRGYEHKRGVSRVEAEGIRRTFGIVTVSLALHPHIGAHLPAGNAVRDERIAGLHLHHSIPSFEGNPLVGPEVQTFRTCNAGQYKPSYELGKPGSGIMASSPKAQVSGINECGVNHRRDLMLLQTILWSENICSKIVIILDEKSRKMSRTD